MNKPLLHVFVPTWNEEKIILDFIQWYRSRVPECLITIYDNYSTDNTVDIALDNDCEVRFFNSGDEMDEQTLMKVRNNCWKDSEAEWCLVVDADELVDVTIEKLNTLSEFSVNIFKCDGYEMFGTEEDTIKTLTQGCKSAGYCKPVLFKTKHFEEINFAPGSHNASPVAKVEVIWGEPVFKMFHTKWRSWTNGIERAKLLAERRSQHSKDMGWNFHYSLDESIHRDYYENGMKNRIKVR